MPDAYSPDYKKWKDEFEKLGIDEETILIGHSCGGGFLIRWLSENNVKIKKLVLVAPWLDPEAKKAKDFFNFEINKNIQDRVNDIHILFSTDDNKDILASVKTINDKIPNSIMHEFSNFGHFIYRDMKTDKFPELLNIILS
jgi:hypothetical protein